MLTLRKAELEDLRQIFLFAEDWNEEVLSNNILGYDSETVKRSLIELSNGDGSLVLVGVDEEGRVKGHIIGYLADAIFDAEEKHVMCISWYVVPEARGTTLPLRLLRMFEHWADIAGANVIMFSVFKGGSPESLHKFYARMGYTELETIYARRL